MRPKLPALTLFLSLIFLLSACTEKGQTDGVPEFSPKAGWSKKTETRVGYLPNMIMQHPIVSTGPMTANFEDDPKKEEAEPKGSEQFYFDIGDEPNAQQIIVVHPIGMEIPNAIGRKIELTGYPDSVQVTGGKIGKNTYSNEVFHLESWKYLD